MANTTTRLQIRNLALKILNDTPTSQVFQTDVLNKLIEEVELEVGQSWKWQFLKERYSIIAPVFQTLNTSITTASTTIVLSDATNWENTQAAYLMHDICPYTGVSTDTLTGVTGIDVAHEDGQQVFPLIQLPSNYHKLFDVYFGQNSTQGIRKFLYVVETAWEQERFYRAPCCTVLNEDTVSYLQCFGHAEGDTIIIEYQKKPDTYLTDASVSSYPDEYIPYIARMVAGQAKIFYDDDLDGMGTRFYQMAVEKLNKMAKLYGEREQGMSRLIQSTYINRAQGGNYGWYGTQIIHD